VAIDLLFFPNMIVPAWLDKGCWGIIWHLFSSQVMYEFQGLYQRLQGGQGMKCKRFEQGREIFADLGVRAKQYLLDTQKRRAGASSASVIQHIVFFGQKYTDRPNRELVYQTKYCN